MRSEAAQRSWLKVAERDYARSAFRPKKSVLSDVTAPPESTIIHSSKLSSSPLSGRAMLERIPMDDAAARVGLWGLDRRGWMRLRKIEASIGVEKVRRVAEDVPDDQF